MSNIQQLAQRAAKGDRAAFGSLYEQTKNGVWFTCISLLKNEENAKDIMQDTYIAAYENLGSLTDFGGIQGWLNKIAANKCKNYIKSKANSALAEDSEELLENIPDDKFLPEEYVTDMAKRRLIMDIIEKSLSVEQYRTVILYYFDEMTAAEIAELMDCHEKTVLYRLKTARSKIKEGVMRYEEKNKDKLHAVVFVPILTRLLRLEAETVSVPNIKIALQDPPKAKNSVPSDAAASAAEQGGKAMFHSLKAKVIAGVCAVAVVGGGVAAGVMISNNSKNIPENRPAVSASANASEPASVSEPAEQSTPAAFTSETVSEPDEQSDTAVSQVDYYGKAVEGDFEYQYLKHRNKIDQSAVMITKYTGSEEKVTIPSEIGGKPVKSLQETFEYNRTVTEVTIPESVIYLEKGVFNDCRSLTKVNFLGAPKLIRDGVFADCKALEYIELPDGVEMLGYSVFDGSKNLKTVIFPDSVSRIEEGAFRRCSEHIEVHYKGKIYTKETIIELYELCPYVFDPND